jgi:tetratricopeptide (TPR) repeat protein
MSGFEQRDRSDDSLKVAAAAELLTKGKAEIRSGNFVAARELLERLLADYPNHSEALYFVSVALRYEGNLEGALASLQKLIDIEPSYGRAWQERGHTLLAFNDTAGARAAFQQAVRQNSSLIASWRLLAELTNRETDPKAYDSFKDQFERLAALPPELLGVRNMMEEGKLAKAEQLCRSFLQRHPKNIEGMRLLADLGVKTHVLDDAEFILESALVYEPNDKLVRFDYMNVLYKRQKFELCMAQAEILLESEPDNNKYRFAYANQCVAVGRFDEALALYNEFVELDPNAAPAHLLRGHALKTVGRVDEAVEAYRAVYRAKSDFGDAFWSLANLKTYRFEDAEIAQMREKQHAESTSVDDKIHLCFALGKAMEDAQDYQSAAEHYLLGNQLKNAQTQYDKDRMTFKLAQQRTVCTAQMFENFGDAGCSAPDPIFIVGLPRAGSTLLEQILASHSLVDGTLELNNIPAIAHRLNGRRMVNEEPRYPMILNHLTPDMAQKLGQTYIDETQIHREGGQFFIDKMPNNFRDVGLIKMILPNAKVIDARRHPMSCCFSGFKQLFFEGQEFTYGLSEIGTYYRDYVELMDHWDEVLPGFILRVQHEDLVDDLETQVRRMLNFCGLPFEQSCIDFHKTKRNVRTPSSEQVRQPIFRTALDAWQNYEPWLDPLKEALGEDVRRRFDIT